MATATATRSAKPDPPPAPWVPPPHVKQHRFTVEQYHQMARVGILKEGERVELLNGLIFQKMTVNPPHSYTVRELSRLLILALRTDWVVSVQQPVTIAGGDSEPEPDVAVAVGPYGRYAERHPGPRDVALLVEVADSSLAEDQTVKFAIYAAARVPVYWIVNLVDRRVEVYTQPRGGKNPTYRTRRDYGPDDAVPVVLAGRQVGSIPVREILPR
jgi:Uma2 family endonuclease